MRIRPCSRRPDRNLPRRGAPPRARGGLAGRVYQTADRGRHRRRGGQRRPGRERGRHRGAQGGRQRDRRGGRRREHARRHRAVRRRPGRRGLHGHLPGQDRTRSSRSTGARRCPERCTPQLFIDPSTGDPLPFEEARRSGLSVGVPGMVATWAKAIQLYGTQSFADDLQPAIDTRRPRLPIDENFVQQEQASLTTCARSPAAARCS